MSDAFTPLTGGCSCGCIRYEIRAPALFVHGCHCHECQRLCGSAFCINYMVESTHVHIVSETKPISVRTPSSSGYGQLLHRCPSCYVTISSYYGGSGPVVTFLRAATLDIEHQAQATPDIHIFTASKMPWVQLPDDKPAYKEFYTYEDHWPKESLERRQQMKPLVKAWKARGERFWYGKPEVVERDKIEEMMASLKL